MRLHSTDIQTRQQQKISIIPIFSLFFLTDLILRDPAEKNMN